MLDKVGNTLNVKPAFTQRQGKVQEKIIDKPTDIVENINRGIKKEELEKVVQGMNDFLKPSNTHLKFEFHDELKEYYVTVVDDTTHEIVKEIPSRKLLDIYAAMTDYLGILVDKRI